MSEKEGVNPALQEIADRLKGNNYSLGIIDPQLTGCLYLGVTNLVWDSWRRDEKGEGGGSIPVVKFGELDDLYKTFHTEAVEIVQVPDFDQESDLISINQIKFRSEAVRNTFIIQARSAIDLMKAYEAAFPPKDIWGDHPNDSKKIVEMIDTLTMSENDKEGETIKVDTILNEFLIKKAGVDKDFSNYFKFKYLPPSQRKPWSECNESSLNKKDGYRRDLERRMLENLGRAVFSRVGIIEISL